MNTTSTASAEIQHTNRAHARLNASSSHRWMMCPPSVKLSEQFEDKLIYITIPMVSPVLFYNAVQ